MNDFRIDILRNNIKIGEAFTENIEIRFNESSQVMKGVRFNMKKIRMNGGYLFDFFKDRIRPMLIQGDNESPLGVFMVMAAPRTVSEVSDYYELEGYDETMLLKQAAFTSRTFYAAGTTYLSIINTLLTSVGFTNVIADNSAAVLPNDLEVAVGDNYLDFINKLLDAINFRHVYEDASGAIRLSRIQNKTSPDFVYRSGKQFNIIPPIKLNKDIYDLPNVVIGIWSSPDSNTPVVYTKRNDDMNSVISTINRGYEVVKTLNVYNIASSNEMKDYVDRIAFESMQATESVTFETVIEAGHEPGTALQVDTEDIDGLFIESQWTMRVSQTAFRMQHTAERKVFV